MRINSVPDVKCFCNNKNVLCLQSMVWHFVYHPVLTEYFKHAAHSPFFFLFKMPVFHNSIFFGSCNIHILNMECAKIFKEHSGAKELNVCSNILIFLETLLVELFDIHISAVFGISKRVESTSTCVFFSCSVYLPVLLNCMFFFFVFAHYVLLATYLLLGLKICILAFYCSKFIR